MESVQDEEREGDTRYNAPRQHPIKPELKLLRNAGVCHEGVEDPQGDVGEQEECDDLATWLGQHLVSGSTGTTTSLRHQHVLERYLQE